DLNEWRNMVAKLKRPGRSVEIAVVGKYVELHDAYLSVKESLAHAGIANDARVEIRWVHAESLESSPAEELLTGVDGIIVPGGFGERGWEGKIRAATFARTTRTPYLGLCL